MSIINEQNILGNPELAGATRPGSSVTLASYSFTTGGYEKVLYEALGNARGGGWTQPTSYSGEVAQAEVEGEASTEEQGPGGEPTQSDATQYGTQGDAPLTENATQTTKLEQAATVIAGETYADQFINSTSTAVRSELNKDEGVQGPTSSGGASNGYEATNPYEGWGNVQDGRGATTEPALIEGTGIRQFVGPDPERGGTAPSTDNPQSDRSIERPKNAGAGMPDPNRVHAPNRTHSTRNKPSAQEGLDMGAKYF